MKSHVALAAVTVSLGLAPAALAGEGDWPHFRGPDHTASVERPGLAFDGSGAGPQVLWRVPVGPGYGGMAARDGEVFVLDREVGVKDVLRVFDLASGAERWSAAYDAPGRLSFPGSRTVPTVTEGHVYTCGGFGQVHCFDRVTHEVVWSTDMEEMYDGAMPIFGWSCSPLVVDDLVVVAPLGEFVGLLAFDRFTGEEAWITDGVGFSHSSPTLVNLHGKDQILFLSNTEQGSGQDAAAPMMVSSFDPADGTLLWRHTTTLTRLPIPGPIRVDDEHVFLTGGYRGGSTLLRVAKDGTKYAFEEIFHIERGAQVHAPILHGDHLYVVVNENWNNDNRSRRKEGGLLCLGLDGKERWRTGEEPFFGRGNLMRVGDHLLIQDGFDATLRVVRATPEGYRQVAEANLFGLEDRKDHQTWAPMALAGDKLLMRSDTELLCASLAGGAE